MTRANIDLVFTPNVDLVPTVRRFVSEFYEQVLLDRLLVSKMALATHELLDNAVRYSTAGDSRLTLEVGDPEARSVRIRTHNRAHAADIAKVERAIAAMKAAPDPLAFYQELMRRSVKNPVGSGLGLGRIFAEADMDLHAVAEADTLVLQATLR